MDRLLTEWKEMEFQLLLHGKVLGLFEGYHKCSSQRVSQVLPKTLDKATNTNMR